ncbi:hypothetical protein DL98DRAFT_515957, partial [Cadophora sp. DSE1049]
MLETSTGLGWTDRKRPQELTTPSSSLTLGPLKTPTIGLRCFIRRGRYRAMACPVLSCLYILNHTNQPCSCLPALPGLDLDLNITPTFHDVPAISMLRPGTVIGSLDGKQCGRGALRCVRASVPESDQCSKLLCTVFALRCVHSNIRRIDEIDSPASL